MTNSNEEAAAAVGAWFRQRLPEDWTRTPAVVTADREEIVVLLSLDLPQDDPPDEDDAAAAELAEARAGYIARFREETRSHRIAIAREAEHRYRRKVAWGVRIGDHEELFTHLAVPVMTRLRQPERQVLDTLVDAGVARSRAHALAWCVRLVGDNASSWLGELREAMEKVEEVRRAGPAA